VREKDIYTIFPHKKIAKKLIKKLKAGNVKAAALSEDIKKIDKLKDELNSNGINILNGRILFGYLVYDVIKYIAGIQGRKIETMEVSILANNVGAPLWDAITIDNIRFLASKVKTLNIITNNIPKFKNVESSLYNEMGILIKISNNKNKALLGSDIVVNMDFPSDFISKYRLSNTSIILNINDNIVIKSKKFSGINVNDYEVEIPYEYKLEGFSDKIVYESIVCGDSNLDNIMKSIKKDNVKITKLIGNNGEISNEEIRQIYLTKAV